jgi:hypothetical protein
VCVEYVIGPVEGDPLDLLFEYSRMPDVLTPRGFDVRRLPGSGLRLALDDAEIYFDHDLPGWLVFIEGSLPEERADQLVATVALQVRDATGIPTRWFRND